MKKKFLFSAFVIGSLLSFNLSADEWVFPVGNPDIEPSSSGNGNSSDTFGGWEYTQHFLNDGGGHYGTDIDYTISENSVEDVHKMVRAVARGRVIHSDYNSAWGNCVIVRHDVMRANRYVFSLYGHLNSTSTGIEENRIVYAGQQIGIVGTTGNSSGTHLHLSIFTRDSGNNQWDGVTCRNILGYDDQDTVPDNHTDRYFHTDTSFSRTVTYYDPITFIKFARLGVISPPVIKNFSVNGDIDNATPSQLHIGENTVEIQIATYMKEISASLSLRNYSGARVNGNMELIDTETSGWIMSGSYNSLGTDIENGGWNAEYLTTYRYTFNLDSVDNSVDIAVFWKPLNYKSSKLIMPIPSGVAHDTVSNSSRYVNRSVEEN